MELNTIILDKIGWTPYSQHRGIGLSWIEGQPFDDDPLVRYFIIIDRKNLCYLIKELDEKEKQTSNKEYKFIELDYSNLKSLKFEVLEFSSNEELFGLISKFSSTNSEYYKRHFTLNKIIR